jgi:predicted DNA-binding transcriptional regulator AlpA
MPRLVKDKPPIDYTRPPERVISLSEFAGYMGIGRATVFRWWKDRREDFPVPLSIRRTCIRFHPLAVRQWMLDNGLTVD